MNALADLLHTEPSVTFQSALTSGEWFTIPLRSLQYAVARVETNVSSILVQFALSDGHSLYARFLTVDAFIDWCVDDHGDRLFAQWESMAKNFRSVLAPPPKRMREMGERVERLETAVVEVLKRAGLPPFAARPPPEDEVVVVEDVP